MKGFVITAVAITLSACAVTPTPVAKQTPQTTKGLCGESLSKQDGMKISMAKQAFQRGQYFSSLATLEQIDSSLVTKQALQASAYRKTGQLAKAQTLYTHLLSSCIEGNAAHGLGLIAAYQGDVRQAQQWLSQAVREEPANANIRNDYGFLLLSTGEEQQARNEFITALELNPQHQTAAKNLWLVLLRNHEDLAASQLKARFAWSDTESQKMTQAAKQLKPISVMEKTQ